MIMSFDNACKMAQILANADKENYIISKTGNDFEIQKENGFTKTVYLQVLPEY